MYWYYSFWSVLIRLELGVHAPWPTVVNLPLPPATWTTYQALCHTGVHSWRWNTSHCWTDVPDWLFLPLCAANHSVGEAGRRVSLCSWQVVAWLGQGGWLGTPGHWGFVVCLKPPPTLAMALSQALFQRWKPLTICIIGHLMCPLRMGSDGYSNSTFQEDGVCYCNNYSL